MEKVRYLNTMNIAFCLESSFNSGGMERMLSVITNALAYLKS